MGLKFGRLAFISSALHILKEFVEFGYVLVLREKKSSSHMLSTEVSGVSSCISQRFCNYRTCSRLRLSRIFLATTALRHTGLQSKTECRSSVSPTYSKQEARRRKLHYLKAELAKSWSAWRWGSDRNQDTRMQRQTERRGNWDGYGDGHSKLHVEKEAKRFRASRKEKKLRRIAEVLAIVRKTEGSAPSGWGIGAEHQSTEQSMVKMEKGPGETEQIKS